VSLPRIAASFLLLTACFVKIDGSLKVDEAPFVAKSCHTGQKAGFYGVELSDAGGRRFQLIAYRSFDYSAERYSGIVQTMYFAAGQPTGDDLGSCVEMTMKRGLSTSHGYERMNGVAEFSCVSATHRISGRIMFENCY
jgi:hypothetical protein